MDILITILLGATIFYALRLSKHLDAFRSNRSDMERLIRDLSSQITRAQEGITTLDDVAKESSDELRKLVDKATGLSDELQIMTESGNKLAERLENLATRNREISDHMSQTSVNLTYPGGKAPVFAAEKKVEAPTPEKSVAKSFFSIRDPDFSSAAEDDDGDDNGMSQSEKQLAAALRRKGKGDY
ncbi:MAG: hypothetical protein DI586_10940 [Micavibrio aeruginosavorus]|uniref:DUF6468 domain-containing protein n=1 Tax=Micavibrio aeruginosavorus TaxID=349221 RepID=A0A2W5FGT5_9BACT|nr:MAG: hypothetical protein DI586_10940 [Micavibrio aeruginosavorus]